MPHSGEYLPTILKSKFYTLHYQKNQDPLYHKGLAQTPLPFLTFGIQVAYWMKNKIMETFLCSNCTHSLACIHKVEQSKIQRLNCELHETTEHGGPRSQVNVSADRLIGFSDLCSLCDFQQNCSLKKGNEFIFYCEEYQ